MEGRCWEAASVFVAFCAVSMSSLLGRDIATVSLLLRLIPRGLHATVDPAGSILWGLGCSWLCGAVAISQPAEKLAWPWGTGQGPLLSTASLLHAPQALRSALSVPDESQRGDWEPDTRGGRVCRREGSVTPPNGQEDTPRQLVTAGFPPAGGLRGPGHQEGLGVGIWVGDHLAGQAAAQRCLCCSERLGHTQPKAPIPKSHTMWGCVPVWKGGAFLGETEKGAPQWGHQGRQGWGTSRAGLASVLALCWACSGHAMSSSSAVLEPKLVSKARDRVPSPTARSWWLVGHSEDTAGPCAAARHPGPERLALTPSRRWGFAPKGLAPRGGVPGGLSPFCLGSGVRVRPTHCPRRT